MSIDSKKTFEQWKKEVDQAVQRLCGLSADDLPDYCYMDAYEDDEAPRCTARKAIRAAKE